MTNRLRRAKLRQPNACIEDIDFRQPRGLDKSLVLSLASGRWLREHLKRPHHRTRAAWASPGSPAHWLIRPAATDSPSCTCAYRGCCTTSPSPAATAPMRKLLASFAKLHLIVLDDFGLAKLNSDNRRDLLELLEDRYATRSTLVTSQLPIENWHDALGDPTFADAILDRLVHNAYKLKLKGGSMRKKKAPLTQADH